MNASSQFSPAMQKAMDAIIAQSFLTAAKLRQQDRTARRARVNEFSRRDGYWPLIAWLTKGLDHRDRLAWSISEAMAMLRKEITFQNAKRRNAHWSFNPGRLADAKSRLIVARYFNAFGREIWSVDASDEADTRPRAA